MNPNPALIDRVIAALVAAGIRPRAAFEPHATLDGDLGLDTLDRECAAIACEDVFGIEIGEAAPDEWQTVADIARTIEAVLPRPQTGEARA